MITEEMEMLISRYDDGDLTDAERASLEAALDSDPEAQGLLKEYRRLNAALSEAPAGMAQVDLAAFSHTLSRSLTERRVVRRTSRTWWRLGPVAAVAATILVGVGALWLSQHTGDTPGVSRRSRIPGPERTMSVTLSVPLDTQVPRGAETENGGEVIWCISASPQRLAKAARPIDDEGLEIFF